MNGARQTIHRVPLTVYLSPYLFKWRSKAAQVSTDSRSSINR